MTYTPDPKVLEEEAEYLNDFYTAAIRQKPRLTVHCHYDGTDEALCQAFFQTRIPNVFLLRFFGRLLRVPCEQACPEGAGPK